ncbi:MAG: L-aspartate oxidase, partial [Desulfurococcales archaeon ex4484_42]
MGLLIGDYILHGGTAMDLEFIQFHPTAYISSDGNVVLITEAVRGRGARIIDEKGHRFVNELAPRDVLSIEIYKRIRNGEKVYLDLRGLNDLDRKFPHLYKALLQVGINPFKDVIPISPAAHYSIGGIAVDIYYRTEIRNLYAIG